MSNVLGIDEAGRGPVIGPLVMAGFLIAENEVDKLIELGVKDSKKLSSARREELDPELRKIGKVFLEVIQPWQIDAANLNLLERRATKKIIISANPQKVIIDAFETRLKEKLNKPAIEIIAEYKADDKYPVVGAASIVAKVYRDNVIKELTKEYGPMGSGYPSDPETRVFVENWIKTKKVIPPFIRKTWGTTRTIIEEIEQKSLIDF